MKAQMVDDRMYIYMYIAIKQAKSVNLDHAERGFIFNCYWKWNYKEFWNLSTLNLLTAAGRERQRERKIRSSLDAEKDLHMKKVVDWASKDAETKPNGEKQSQQQRKVLKIMLIRSLRTRQHPVQRVL